MTNTASLKYTQTHEWVSLNGKTATVGITDHAQKEISDVVFVELPKEGRVVKAGESVMVIESVKAAFDIYTPIAGKITKVNQDLKNQPQLVNDSPYENGWLFQLEASSPQEADSLMTEEQYQKSKGSH